MKKYEHGNVARFRTFQERLKKTLNTLDERERKIITLRYGLEDDYLRTLDEVAREFGLTRERVRQIEFKALRKLGSTSCGGRLEDLLED